MSYFLFLDDERNPMDVTWQTIGHGVNYQSNWVIVRTEKEARDFISEYGIPDFISFDHDLGEGNGSGHGVAKFLVDYCLDNGGLGLCGYAVHSKNPVGAENIIGLLDGYYQHWLEEKHRELDVRVGGTIDDIYKEIGRLSI